MHPNEQLLREEYRARADRDDRSLADVFADDIVWHVPGKNAIAGEYRGRDQVPSRMCSRMTSTGSLSRAAPHCETGSVWNGERTGSTGSSMAVS
jgi:uncharacterized protein